MKTQTFISVILLFLLGTTSCSDTVSSSETDPDNMVFMEPMTTALMSLEPGDVSGNGIFILNWSSLKPRFTADSENKLGMAMAIGFNEEVSFKPPYNRSTADMGAVRIQSAQGESIELRKESSRFTNEKIIYSHRSFGPFSDQATLNFLAGGEYSIRTAGSDVFPALNLEVSAPEKKVSILTPSAHRMENHSGNIELSWDAIPGKPVAIHIRPSVISPKGRKPGTLNRENSEMILLKDHKGVYTISGKTLSEIADRSGAGTLHISVAQLHVSDFESGGQTYRVIMRSADHRVVKLN